MTLPDSSIFESGLRGIAQETVRSCVKSLSQRYGFDIKEATRFLNRVAVSPVNAEVVGLAAPVSPVNAEVVGLAAPVRQSPVNAEVVGLAAPVSPVNAEMAGLAADPTEQFVKESMQRQIETIVRSVIAKRGDGVGGDVESGQVGEWVNVSCDDGGLDTPDWLVSAEQQLSHAPSTQQNPRVIQEQAAAWRLLVNFYDGADVDDTPTDSGESPLESRQSGRGGWVVDLVEGRGVMAALLARGVGGFPGD